LKGGLSEDKNNVKGGGGRKNKSKRKKQLGSNSSPYKVRRSAKTHPRRGAAQNLNNKRKEQDRAASQKTNSAAP